MTPQTLFISSVQKEFTEDRAALKAFVEGDALLTLSRVSNYSIEAMVPELLPE